MSIFDRASNSSYWRGFDYYETKRVKELTRIGDDVYSAKVNGTETYDVVVDLNHPLKSTCTCPFTKGNHKMCKHMLAVAFSLCPDEVKRANKIREDYYYEQEHKEERLDELMKQKEKEIIKYVKSLSNKEAKDELYNRLVNEAYREAYREVYGYDDYDDSDY